MGENYPLNLYVGARFLTCILKVNKVRSVFQVFLLVLGTRWEACAFMVDYDCTIPNLFTLQKLKTNFQFICNSQKYEIHFQLVKP